MLQPIKRHSEKIGITSQKVLLKQITKTWEKNIATNKKTFWENSVVSKFLQPQIQCFKQNSLNCVIKYEPFQVTVCKRSMRLFWN